ncbi:MAG: hypothetical protein QNK31_00700 [Porticoccus sp.]|nr:hypothetical protein [Porticoccus sp.]
MSIYLLHIELYEEPLFADEDFVKISGMWHYPWSGVEQDVPASFNNLTPSLSTTISGDFAVAAFVE